MNYQQKIHKLTALLLIAAITLTAVSSASCQKMTATTMQLMKTEGTVGIADGKGKTIEPAERLNLYSGYHMATETKSYAWIDLDSVKLAKMDEGSQIEIQKSGKKLEILLNAGGLFFHVTEPLGEDETMEIRTSSMMVGIRGTCGWVVTTDPEHMQVYILEGTVECTVTNPETGRGKSAYISGGEIAQLTAYSEDKDGEIRIQDFTLGDIPEYILEEILEDDALLEKILADSDMDLQNWEEGGEGNEDRPAGEADGEDGNAEQTEDGREEAESQDISVEAGDGWREAYQSLIAQANSWDFGEEHGEWLDRLGTIPNPNIPPFSAYYLHDINGDGIPELIVSVSNDLEVLFAYYTYREGEGALYIGEDWRSVRAGLYKESSGQMMIIEFERYEDVGKLYQVTLPGDQILIQPSGEARSGEIEAAGRSELDWSYGDDLSLLQNYVSQTP